MLRDFAEVKQNLDKFATMACWLQMIDWLAKDSQACCLLKKSEPTCAGEWR